MSGTKKLRVWYNLNMRNAKICEFNSKFTTLDEKSLLEQIRTCDFKTLRLICNAMDGYNYSSDCLATIFTKLPYEKIKIFRNALNERVNAILGDYSKLYDMLILSQKHECWNGDERYKLFSYDLPPYADKKVMKTLVILVCEYIGKPLTIENMKKIDYLYNCGPTSDLTKSFSLGKCSDWETNDKSFLTLNNQRKAECEAWYTFMNHVYDGNFEKANSIIKRYETIK